jgi:hypothetical protein
MYFEIDYSLFQANGSNTTTTANWFTSMFNNVHTLYANAGISVSLKSMFIWTTPDPYTGTNSSAQLSNFHNYRPTFDGDLGQLVGVDTGNQGGISATVFGTCSSSNYSYVDVDFGYNTVPTYSWTVQVITHEMGHLLGSNHTHACVWNGNNTPIDGCGQTVGLSEGTCATGPIPSSGTIMSYCNLINTVGINFANGFGPQPSARIISFMNSSTCLSTDCVSTCINAVNNVAVTAQTTTSLTVGWADNSDTASWSVGIFTFSGVGTYTTVNSPTFSKTGLLPNTFYKVRIKPACGAGESITYREFIVATPADWCGGVTITDTGGVLGTYAANQKYTRTFTPSAGNKIKLTFTQMNLESGFDIIQVYNGMDTSSLVGTYTGTTLPAAITSAAADGALTLRFISNASVNLSGYTATVNCTPITSVTCSTNTTWSGTAWSNGLPSDSKSAIINGNYTTGASFKCCNLIINAGKTLTVTAGTYVCAVNNVTINGSLIVQDKGELVQISNSGVNTGNGHFYRSTGSLNISDYVYWSSPTDNSVIGTALTGWSNYYKYYAPNFIDTQTINSAGTVTANVPDGLDDNGNSWQSVTSTTAMSKGVGYIARTPTAGIKSVDFYGKPTTGNVLVPLLNSGSLVNHNYNLVGNPYPSSISATDLIWANTGTTGVLYFWTHKTSVTATTPGAVPGNYASTGDFSAYSLTGGVASESGSAIPTAVIASHQAFFVEKATAANFSFTNAMRSTSLLNNTFLRQAAKTRLWLSLSDTNGHYHQILVGYLPDTAKEYDWGYDAKMSTLGLPMSMYSLIDDDTYRIQSRGDFDSSDVVPIGFAAQNAGAFTISVDQSEGEIEKVFIRDKYTGHTYSLSEPYTFTSEAGDFDKRFEIIYEDDSTGKSAEVPIRVFPNPTSDFVNVSGKFEKYELYDMYGKLIRSGSESSISLEGYSNGIYLLKIDDGKTFKVIKS